jgi:hypothetical protein
MSSVYRVLCLSHDPAIEVGRWENHGRDAAIAAAASRTIEGHESCDLMVGRYSYPLIELCCPATPGALAHGRHSTPQWADADWLRLLALAIDLNEPDLASAVVDLVRRGCWTAQRLSRLRGELGLQGER